MKALPDCLIVLSSHVKLQRSSDVTYPFRQDSNFWYLTGINEPDLLLVINTKSAKSTLLVPEQNDYQKEWDGEIETKTLQEVSGVDGIGLVDELNSMLKQAKTNRLQICHLAPAPERIEPYGFYSNPARRLLQEKLMPVEQKPKDIRIELARLRQIKEKVEIEAITQAINVTQKTLEHVKNNLANYTNEKEVERSITTGFYTNGGDGHAYEPIVASGKNASTIHYNKNNASLAKNSLLLLDVGANYGGYAADISRTWSIGELSKRQNEIFKHVQSLQQIAYKKLKPGVYLREYQKEMEHEAQKVMKKIGVESGKYPHGFSHFLGLDVHDAGDYEQPLQENCVITVEPGIYLSNEGIGIRIEDDVLVTKTGIKVLSENIPQDL